MTSDRRRIGPQDRVERRDRARLELDEQERADLLRRLRAARLLTPPRSDLHTLFTDILDFLNRTPPRGDPR